MLIEDTEWGYQYVITAPLQSDPVEDVFPSTGEWVAVGFLSICKKSKIPRGFCNTVSLLKENINFWEEDLTSENQECVQADLGLLQHPRWCV